MYKILFPIGFIAVMGLIAINSTFEQKAEPVEDPTPNMFEQGVVPTSITVNPFDAEYTIQDIYDAVITTDPSTTAGVAELTTKLKEQPIITDTIKIMEEFSTATEELRQNAVAEYTPATDDATDESFFVIPEINADALDTDSIFDDSAAEDMAALKLSNFSFY